MQRNVDSRFLYHTSCPVCGSRDNVAVYDDGHGWCFGCRKIVIEPEFRQFREQRKVQRDNGYTDSNAGSGDPERNSNDPNSTLVLPRGYSRDIDFQGLEWLNKYNLTSKEISENRIGWDQEGWKIRKGTIQYSPLMIFPVFDIYDNLLMYQARYFGNLKNVPKYWTVGNRAVIHTIGNNPRVCTLVEDLLSAIKVGRYTTGIPIFGSDISTETVLRLRDRYETLLIWLDKDKRRYAHARALSIRYLFNSVRVIDSEADPKDYDNQELKEYLNND